MENSCENYFGMSEDQIKEILHQLIYKIDLLVTNGYTQISVLPSLFLHLFQNIFTFFLPIFSNLESSLKLKRFLNHLIFMLLQNKFDLTQKLFNSKSYLYFQLGWYSLNLSKASNGSIMLISGSNSKIQIHFWLNSKMNSIICFRTKLRKFFCQWSIHWLAKDQIFNLFCDFGLVASKIIKFFKILLFVHEFL